MSKEFTPVQGCPVADGGAACPRCGGGWPGTRITTEAMTKAVAGGNLDPTKLGCQTLIDRATAGIEELNKP